MNIPPPESGCAKTVTGVLPSPKLENFAHSHPFTQQVRLLRIRYLSDSAINGSLQIDVVFPSSDVLEAAFAEVKTKFVTGKSALSEAYEQSQPSSTR